MADRKLDAEITVEFNEAASRQSLNSGDSVNTLFGKIKKFFSDLKPVAFSGDAETVSGHTVAADVPALGYYYATCSTGLEKNVKEVTCEGFEVKEGARITICFTAGNGGTPPNATYILKINDDAGRPIAYNDWQGDGVVDMLTAKTSELCCGNQTWDFVFHSGRFLMTTFLGNYIIDDTLNKNSMRCVQNKVIKAALDEKANVDDIPDLSPYMKIHSDIPQQDSASTIATVKQNNILVSGDYVTKPTSGKKVVRFYRTYAPDTSKYVEMRMEADSLNSNISFQGDLPISAFTVSGKQVAYSTDIPTSLPANGGDADTIAGQAISTSGEKGIPVINGDYGTLEIGQRLDFHNAAGQDYVARLDYDASSKRFRTILPDGTVSTMPTSADVNNNFIAKRELVTANGTFVSYPQQRDENGKIIFCEYTRKQADGSCDKLFRLMGDTSKNTYSDFQAHYDGADNITWYFNGTSDINILVKVNGQTVATENKVPSLAYATGTLSITSSSITVNVGFKPSIAFIISTSKPYQVAFCAQTYTNTGFVFDNTTSVTETGSGKYIAFR